MVMISKKRHLVWILVSAVSCYAGPEYTTRHGLRIWDHSYNREDIEGLTAEFLALAPYGCYGITTPLTMIDIYAWTPCLRRTAFVHELAHMARGLVEHDVDYNHRDVVFWGPDGLVSNLGGDCESTGD